MERVYEILKEKGIKLHELAAALGVTRQTLFRQITGNCTLDTMRKIADALNVPLWQLFASDKDVIEDINRRKGGSMFCPHCGEPLSINVD